jgi:hypothetical protein
MLQHGANPNDGSVLYWLVKTYFHCHWTELQLQEILDQFVHVYGANVNYKGTKKLLLHYVLYWCWDQSLYPVVQLKPWTDRIYSILQLFVQYKGNLNSFITIDNTISTKLWNYTIWMKLSEKPEVFQFVNNLTLYLLRHGANMHLGHGRNGWKLLHTLCYTCYTELIELLFENHKMDHPTITTEEMIISKELISHNAEVKSHFIDGHDSRTHRTTVFHTIIVGMHSSTTL